MRKGLILEELLKNQIKNISYDRKLKYIDLKRIANKLNKSVFTEECSIWDGYISNLHNVKKGVYINFYHNNKKTALHRLLYQNFIGSLLETEYVKYTCCNNGKCCSIKHMVKYKYVSGPRADKSTSTSSINNGEENNEGNNICITDNKDGNNETDLNSSLVIEF